MNDWSPAEILKYTAEKRRHDILYETRHSPLARHQKLAELDRQLHQELLKVSAPLRTPNHE